MEVFILFFAVISTQQISKILGAVLEDSGVKYVAKDSIYSVPSMSHVYPTSECLPSSLHWNCNDTHWMVDEKTQIEPRRWFENTSYQPSVHHWDTNAYYQPTEHHWKRDVNCQPPVNHWDMNTYCQPATVNHWKRDVRYQPEIRYWETDSYFQPTAHHWKRDVEYQPEIRHRETIAYVQPAVQHCETNTYHQPVMHQWKRDVQDQVAMQSWNSLYNQPSAAESWEKVNYRYLSPGWNSIFDNQHEVNDWTMPGQAIVDYRKDVYNQPVLQNWNSDWTQVDNQKKEEIVQLEVKKTKVKRSKKQTVPKEKFVEENQPLIIDQNIDQTVQPVVENRKVRKNFIKLPVKLASNHANNSDEKAVPSEYNINVPSAHTKIDSTFSNTSNALKFTNLVTSVAKIVNTSSTHDSDTIAESRNISEVSILPVVTKSSGTTNVAKSAALENITQNTTSNVATPKESNIVYNFPQHHSHESFATTNISKVVSIEGNTVTSDVNNISDPLSSIDTPRNSEVMTQRLTAHSPIAVVLVDTSETDPNINKFAVREFNKSPTTNISEAIKVASSDKEHHESQMSRAVKQDKTAENSNIDNVLEVLNTTTTDEFPTISNISEAIKVATTDKKHHKNHMSRADKQDMTAENSYIDNVNTTTTDEFPTTSKISEAVKINENDAITAINNSKETVTITDGKTFDDISETVQLADTTSSLATTNTSQTMPVAYDTATHVTRNSLERVTEADSGDKTETNTRVHNSNGKTLESLTYPHDDETSSANNTSNKEKRSEKVIQIATTSNNSNYHSSISEASQNVSNNNNIKLAPLGQAEIIEKHPDSSNIDAVFVSDIATGNISDVVMLNSKTTTSSTRKNVKANHDGSTLPLNKGTLKYHYRNQANTARNISNDIELGGTGRNISENDQNILTELPNNTEGHKTSIISDAIELDEAAKTLAASGISTHDGKIHLKFPRVSESKTNTSDSKTSIKHIDGNETSKNNPETLFVADPNQIPAPISEALTFVDSDPTTTTSHISKSQMRNDVHQTPVSVKFVDTPNLKTDQNPSINLNLEATRSNALDQTINDNINLEAMIEADTDQIRPSRYVSGAPTLDDTIQSNSFKATDPVGYNTSPSHRISNVVNIPKSSSILGASEISNSVNFDGVKMSTGHSVSNVVNLGTVDSPNPTRTRSANQAEIPSASHIRNSVNFGDAKMAASQNVNNIVNLGTLDNQSPLENPDVRTLATDSEMPTKHNIINSVNFGNVNSDLEKKNLDPDSINEGSYHVSVDNVVNFGSNGPPLSQQNSGRSLSDVSTIPKMDVSNSVNFGSVNDPPQQNNSNPRALTEDSTNPKVSISNTVHFGTTETTTQPHESRVRSNINNLEISPVDVSFISGRGKLVPQQVSKNKNNYPATSQINPENLEATETKGIPLHDNSQKTIGQPLDNSNIGDSKTANKCVRDVTSGNAATTSGMITNSGNRQTGSNSISPNTRIENTIHYGAGNSNVGHIISNAVRIGASDNPPSPYLDQSVNTPGGSRSVPTSRQISNQFSVNGDRSNVHQISNSVDFGSVDTIPSTRFVTDVSPITNQDQNPTGHQIRNSVTFSKSAAANPFANYISNSVNFDPGTQDNSPDNRILNSVTFTGVDQTPSASQISEAVVMPNTSPNVFSDFTHTTGKSVDSSNGNIDHISTVRQITPLHPEGIADENPTKLDLTPKTHTVDKADVEAAPSPNPPNQKGNASSSPKLTDPPRQSKRHQSSTPIKDVAQPHSWFTEYRHLCPLCWIYFGKNEPLWCLECFPEWWLSQSRV